MRTLHSIVVVVSAAFSSSLQADPEWKVLKAGQGGANLLRNPGFNELADGQPAAWRKWQDGFEVEAKGGREGSVAVVCEVTRKGQESGLGQTIVLDRQTAAPLVVRGWSKAEGVDGSPDGGYSIYVDLQYQDGTPLWGQTANFRCGTHDWQPREIVITPEKPVKSLSLYCLLRGHQGKVWFDDLGLSEVAPGAGACLFQGLPVAAVSPSAPPPLPAQGSELIDHVRKTGRFLVRDVAAGSDFFRADGPDAASLDLRVVSKAAASEGRVHFSGSVTSTAPRDRAVTVVFTLPFDAAGWKWGTDIRRQSVIEGAGEYANTVPVGCGATGSMSLYPLAAIWNEQHGLALAVDPEKPTICRLGYQAGLKSFFIALDYGLSPETTNFPNRADFGFVLYPFDPREGFRSAFTRYQEIFREFYLVRAKEQGLWMPFTDVSTVKGWEDFGFRFHEGDNNVPWDDEHGVLSFRYTEPMTWWMRMEKGLPRTPAAAAAVRDKLVEGNDAHAKRMALATRSAAMFDESGQAALRFEDTPWCDGAVWSLNPNPWIGQDKGGAEGDAPNAANVYWSPRIMEELYGPKAKGRLDGEYLDSIEGYVTADLNFRREHFRTTTVPLSFTTDTHRPALFKGLAVYEFTRWMSEDVHRDGHLMFANGVPYRLTFLCPWLDVMGTETNWLEGARYQPPPLSQMDLWRTMSGGKPYLLLMNTNYDRFTPDLVGKYFHRCLFYGMWPGFFSHNASENPYWGNPKWYDRDRPLFKRFLPLVEKVAEAGWRPETGAKCDNPALLVERFGPNANGVEFLTVYNDTEMPQSGSVRTVVPGGGEKSWPVTLPPQEAAVIETTKDGVVRP